MSEEKEKPHVPSIPTISTTPDMSQHIIKGPEYKGNMASIASPSVHSKSNIFNQSAASQMFSASQRGSKETYQNMSSGLSVLGQTAQTHMMKAINHQKSAKEQESLIYARIVKLRKEEERASKRIRDLDRRQKFVHEMHQVKNEKINMINTMYNTRKFIEMDNRNKFNQRR